MHGIFQGPINTYGLQLFCTMGMRLELCEETKEWVWVQRWPDFVRGADNTDVIEEKYHEHWNVPKREISS